MIESAIREEKRRFWHEIDDHFTALGNFANERLAAGPDTQNALARLIEARNWFKIGLDRWEAEMLAVDEVFDNACSGGAVANQPACEAYHYTTAWSDGDKVFVARCKEFPIMGAHGDTAEEALAEIKSVVQACVEDAADKGLPIPSPNGLDENPPSEQT